MKGPYDPPSGAPRSNEREFFKLASRGDQEAFTKIYNHFEPKLFAFVNRMTRSSAASEEIIQELFIKLWTSGEKLAQIENPGAYVFSMAANLTLNYLKKIAREATLVQRLKRSSFASSNQTEEAVSFNESRSLVEQAVAQMPAQRKMVYLMSREQGLNNNEIAKAIKLSPNTVRNHLAEALRSLRLLFQKNVVLLLLSQCLALELMSKSPAVS